MKILKITCTDKQTDQCSKDIYKTHPTVISILHEPNNHLLIEKDDYTKQGHVLKSAALPIVHKITGTFKNKFESIQRSEFVDF